MGVNDKEYMCLRKEGFGKERKYIKTGTVGASEGLSSITSVGQLCTRTLKKRNGRKKLENKNRWRRKGEKTMRRRPRKGKESGDRYVIFFIAHNKMVDNT